MTQLQHQDPLSPMENHEFVAQMAQFSALEQMQNMNQSMQMQQANNLLGRWVEGTYFNDGAMEWREVRGFTEAVVVRNSQPYLRVANGPGPDDFDLLPVARVDRVFPDLFLSSLTNLNQNLSIAQNLSLIGRYIMAVTRGADGRPNGFVEGRVDQIRFDDIGNPILIVGNREILGTEVIAVTEPTGVRRIIGHEIFVPNSDASGDPFVSRTIQDIRFIRGETAQEDRVVVVVEDGEHNIRNIGFTFDAINMIDRPITHENISGTVHSVRLIGGLPYLVVHSSVDDGSGNMVLQEDIVSFASFRRINVS